MMNNKENIKSSKKSKKYILLIILLGFSLLAFVLYRSFYSVSAEKQLAAIEASLAIPDSENAAVYYNNFFYDSNNLAILNTLISYAPGSYYLPWKSENNPAGSTALKTNHMFFEKFVEISKNQEARFSLNSDNFINDRIANYIREITFVLSWAAANDLGDGRIDEAINKYISQIKIGSHLNQQPVSIYKLLGGAIESVGLRNIRDLTMHKDITEEQLNQLDSIVSETQNYIKQDKELEDKIASLLKIIQIKDQPFITRIKTRINNFRTKIEEEKQWQKSLNRIISNQRVSRIMIALRLYQKQYSKWPETLDEIKSSLPKETFTDEMNNSPFVYKLSGDNFVLYSKGPDNIDNNYQKSTDDIIFWEPTNTQAIQKQATDPNQ